MTLKSIFLLLLALFFCFSVHAESSVIIIEAKAGGKNPKTFCTPELSFINHTEVDVGALLINLEWKNKKSGEVLQPVGSMGTMINKFAAGKTVTPFSAGHLVDCNDLELLVGTYACRDENAVRMICPGIISTRTEGGVTINMSSAKEGSMKGAVEPR